MSGKIIRWRQYNLHLELDDRHLKLALRHSQVYEAEANIEGGMSIYLCI
ncbi:hypothetical protein ACFOGG_00905 [Brenneria rubrifaciens]